MRKQINSDKIYTRRRMMKIDITQSNWVGAKDYISKEISRSYDVELGKKYVIKTSEEQFEESGEPRKEDEEVLSFEITDIDDNKIKIHTFQVFSNEERGVDLLSDKQDFVVGVGRPLRLVTPTMDAGDIFIFNLRNE